jgi:peptidyl-prolyl cis-trans isomerase B (cyclophilin B)
MSLTLLFPVVFASAGLLFALPGAGQELPKVPKDGDEVAVMETDKGRIVLMFYPEKAPKHVENFKALAQKGFYDGTRFHRTIPDFMIQGGDPNSKDLTKAQWWGTGGNEVDGREVMVDAEFNDVKHEPGVLSMARSSDPNSASSQFFIMHKKYPSLDGKYSAFGRVVEGMDVVDRIATMPSGDNGSVDPLKAVVIKSVKIEKWPLRKDG